MKLLAKVTLHAVDNGWYVEYENNKLDALSCVPCMELVYRDTESLMEALKEFFTQAVTPVVVSGRGRRRGGAATE